MRSSAKLIVYNIIHFHPRVKGLAVKFYEFFVNIKQKEPKSDIFFRFAKDRRASGSSFTAPARKLILLTLIMQKFS